MYMVVWMVPTELEIFSETLFMLVQNWTNVCDTGPALKTTCSYTCLDVDHCYLTTSEHTQQSRGVGPVLVCRWPIVYDSGPASAQHWANASCLPDNVELALIFSSEVLWEDTGIVNSPLLVHVAAQQSYGLTIVWTYIKTHERYV